MRITLELSHRQRFVTVPINHSYLISSMIYNVIARSSSEYAEQLHEQRYGAVKFTFSPLNLGHHRKWVMHENGTMSTGEKRLYLTISSPKEEFIEHLKLGLRHEPFVSVGMERFRMEPIRELDPPEFAGDMRFVMLSPLVCATKSEVDQYSQYLFPGDPDFKRVLVANLCRKYEILHGKPIICNENDVVFELDRDYVAKVNGKVQKLITLKEGRSDESKVKGTLAPFRLVAPPELIEVGYECGFGEKNAQGFGMVRAINCDHVPLLPDLQKPVVSRP